MFGRHPRRGLCDLDRRGEAARRQNQLLAFDLDLDFGADFPPHLLEDGLIERQARGVADATETFGERYGGNVITS